MALHQAGQRAQHTANELFRPLKSGGVSNLLDGQVSSRLLTSQCKGVGTECGNGEGGGGGEGWGCFLLTA